MLAPQNAAKPVQRKPIGELLREKGLIADGHIILALQDQKVSGERLGEILERMGFVSQYDVALVIAEQERREYLDVEQLSPGEQTLRLFNMNLCLSNVFLPISHGGGEIKVVAAAADDGSELMRVIARQSGLRPVIYQGEKGKIVNAIQYYYYFLDNPVERLLEREVQAMSADVDDVRSVEDLITHLFQLAVKYRTSDIHIRPMDKAINIAFRIDGVLRPMLSLPLSMRRIVSSIKMKANMDIAEQRLPQDGSFSANILNSPYELRVSTTVCPFGENMVLRLLPMRSDFMGLRQLGFFEEDMARLQQMFNFPYGIVLLTGPTGSGKTTTLYAAVRQLNLIEKNVVTVENPIEYRVPLLRQTQVNTKAGYTFASAIRYFLRHDPDVILVGEIRDQETALTAMSASETGHLVLSTLHTNTAIGAIPRLRALGVAPFMLSDALVGVVSQRLVRRICPHCREEYAPSEQERAYLRDPGIDVLYRGRGCDACAKTGYLGRTLIYEVVETDAGLSAAIGRDAEIAEMVQVLQKTDSYRDIFDCAARKARMGILSVDEVVRVLGHKG